MNVIGQFLLYNVVQSVVGGLLVLAVVLVGIHVLRIRHGSLRTCLLTAPLLKSTLALFGWTVLLPWPRDLFRGVQQSAVPAEIVLPALLAIGGIGFLVQLAGLRHARTAVLRGARPAEAEEPRLARAMDRVMSAFQQNDARINGLCPCAPLSDRPHLMVTDQALPSPVAVTHGEPIIVFPRGLVDHLGDMEIQGALAHEVAHFRLRRPRWCSSETIRTLTALNPMAPVMASFLRREEEKACDDIAVAAVGRPAAYAEMLVKSYRFARPKTQPAGADVQALPQLFGWKPLVSERVERLVASRSPLGHLGRQYMATVTVWAVVLAAFFTS